MPIITKKDKLAITMTWSSSNDEQEIDVSITRDGDDDVIISLQSGKSSICVNASFIQEMHSFLKERNIIEDHIDAEKDQPTSSVQEKMTESSGDISSLLGEVRNQQSSGIFSTASLQLGVPSSPSISHTYTSPSMLASMGSAVELSVRPEDNLSSLVRRQSEIKLPNESSDTDDPSDIVEMEDVPPDIFGR